MNPNLLPIDSGSTRVFGAMALVSQPGDARSSNPSACDPFRRSDISRSNLTGVQMGPYELGARLGEGGMGTLFFARHTQLCKPCAVKFIHPSMASNGQAIGRFLQEIRAVGQLNHPHIVCALDAGCCDGVHYYVTELLVGQDLQRHVNSCGPMSVDKSVSVLRQVLQGLAHAHQCGFIHRDIKPSNIFLVADAHAKLLDFGLVRNTQQASDGLTCSEQLLGTLDYLAPEQAEDPTRATAASDIYSLGLTWIYLLSGRTPFPDAQYATAISKLRAHLVDQPQWLTNNPLQLPSSLIDLLTSMVHKDPGQRPNSCQEVIEHLDECLTQTNRRTTNNPLSNITTNPTGIRFKKMWTLAAVSATTVVSAAIVLSCVKQKNWIEPTTSEQVGNHQGIASQSGAGSNNQHQNETTDAPLPSGESDNAAEHARTLPSTKSTANAKAVRRPATTHGNSAAVQSFPFSNTKD